MTCVARALLFLNAALGVRVQRAREKSAWKTKVRTPFSCLKNRDKKTKIVVLDSLVTDDVSLYTPFSYNHICRPTTLKLFGGVLER